VNSLNQKHFTFCNAQAISELAPLQILQQAANPGPCEKEGTQTVSLKEAKTVSPEPLAVRTHPKRMGWVLAANQVRHAPTQLIMMSVHPKLIMIITHQAGLCLIR
jgi:hypothetical protein